MNDEENGEVKFGVADQDYGGEFRYVNKSPQELRRILESETNPVERDAIEWTLLVFQSKRWAAGDPDDPKTTMAGEPYRGEPRSVDRPSSIRSMVQNRRMAEPIRDGLSGGREIPEPIKSGEGLGLVQRDSGIWEEP